MLAFESPIIRSTHGWRARSNSLRTTAAAAMPMRARAFRWRTAFIRMPYARELTVPIGVINDTFECAITWDRFEAFHAAVRKATAAALTEATGNAGTISTRFTHVYPDGPAIYYTFNVRGDPSRLHRAMAAHQGPRLRRPDRRRRHDHPPPRRRARPHALVPRPAPGPIWEGACGGQIRSHPAGMMNPGVLCLRENAAAPAKQMDILKHTLLPLMLFVSTPVLANPDCKRIADEVSWPAMMVKKPMQSINVVDRGRRHDHRTRPYLAPRAAPGPCPEGARCGERRRLIRQGLTN